MPFKLVRHFDSDGPYLEVSPKGTKGWRYRYKTSDDKWKMKLLGHYPKISLEVARELRDGLKSAAQNKMQ